MAVYVRRTCQSMNSQYRLHVRTGLQVLMPWCINKTPGAYAALCLIGLQMLVPCCTYLVIFDGSIDCINIKLTCLFCKCLCIANLLVFNFHQVSIQVITWRTCIVCSETNKSCTSRASRYVSGENCILGCSDDSTHIVFGLFLVE